MSWKDDKAWADTYIPRIKEILGRELIVESTASEDQKQGTDFKVLVVNPYRFAYRLRSFRDSEKYAHDFTLRSWRPSGVATEKDKILQQTFVDFYIYAFSAKEGPDLLAWVILDMHKFRELYDPDLFEIMEKQNFDRTKFMVYQLTSLPPAVIKAASPGYFAMRPGCTCIRCAVARGEID